MTPNQRKAFWRMFSAACTAQGIPCAGKEDYRKRVMLEEASAEHLADISSGAAYDRIMLRLAQDAGDYDAAIYYAGASSKRWIRLIDDRAKRLGVGDAYIMGCRRNAGMSTVGTLEDLPERDLRKLYIMLDKQVKRALSRPMRSISAPRLGPGHTLAEYVEPVSDEEIMAAAIKPPKCSQRRWSMEQKRRRDPEFYAEQGI